MMNRAEDRRASTGPNLAEVCAGKRLGHPRRSKQPMDSWLESFAQANFLRSSDTAHDLKTPLNIAVLNLELLRMRVRKITGEDDEKVLAYAASIETELRRLARIFDAFFVLSTPPRGEGEPTGVDARACCCEIGGSAGYQLAGGEPSLVRAHESRIRQAYRLFFEGISKILKPAGRQAELARDTHFRLTVTGHPETEDFELTRILKFYYTDPLGNPDLSLAAARLIAETYGGELNAFQESDKVAVRMSFPLGES
jgi:hypothetical protein